MSKPEIVYNNRYNKQNYVQISCRVRPEFAEDLREYMARHGLSIPGFLRLALETLEKKETEERK